MKAPHCQHTFAEGKELVPRVTEVKQRKVGGSFRDDHIVTLKQPLTSIPEDKVK